MTLSFFLLANLQPAINVVGIIILLTHFKAKRPYIRLLGFLLAFSFLTHVTILLLYQLKLNPNYASNFYNLFELPIITAIYYQASQKVFNKVPIIITVFHFFFGLWNFMFFQKLEINSYTFAFKAIIVIGYALYYFYWLLKELPTTQLHRLPMFWINSALMIFFSGNLFLFVFTSYLINKQKNDLGVYWYLHNTLACVLSLMLIFALWMDLKNIKLRS